MDKTRILQQGEEAKFQIDIKDFDMDANDFGVTLIYGYRRNVVVISKSNMIKGVDGKWYFMFGTDNMVGRVEIKCVWQIPDSDYPDGLRQEENLQYLCFVASTPYANLITCPNPDNSQPVIYKRSEQSGVADKYEYLLTSQGDILISVDGDILLVLKEQINNE